MFHLIAYDLESRNYENVEAIIESLGEAHRLQLSVWLLETNLSSREIRDAMASALSEDDSLFVCPAKGWASHGVPNDIIEWLKGSS
ncbi:hypothetical protein [uncultured Desulfovibrio sp.]|uniref:hypothetical protein n=1 Tax=uncultured Desulfovibrio sp. TaxID=167968 RepID=UPI0026370311|nr:hypothetical protein [uncultured Desulfovibrio sp.]